MSISVPSLTVPVVFQVYCPVLMKRRDSLCRTFRMFSQSGMERLQRTDVFALVLKSEKKVSNQTIKLLWNFQPTLDLSEGSGVWDNEQPSGYYLEWILSYPSTRYLPDLPTVTFSTTAHPRFRVMSPSTFPGLGNYQAISTLNNNDLFICKSRLEEERHEAGEPPLDPNALRMTCQATQLK